MTMYSPGSCHVPVGKAPRLKAPVGILEGQSHKTRWGRAHFLWGVVAETFKVAKLRLCVSVCMWVCLWACKHSAGVTLWLPENDEAPTVVCVLEYLQGSNRKYICLHVHLWVRISFCSILRVTIMCFWMNDQNSSLLKLYLFLSYLPMSSKAQDTKALQISSTF